MADNTGTDIENEDEVIGNLKNYSDSFSENDKDK